MKPKNDIPIEGILKWLKQERDELQWKLEQLVPYTKSLEKKVDQLEKDLAGCRKQLAMALKEMSHNEFYKELNKKYVAARKDNKQLCQKIGDLYRRLEQYQKHEIT